MGIVRGTYVDGFAPRDYAPRYPSLWNGCVGAWYPGLGPTGASAKDWSGFKRDAIITNQSLTSIWTPKNGLYALNYNGSNGCAIVTTPANCPLDIQGTGMAATCWFYPTVSNVYQCLWCHSSSSVTRHYCLFLSTNGTSKIFFNMNAGGSSPFDATGTEITVSPAWVVNQWNFICYNYDRSLQTVSIWLGTDETPPRLAYQFGGSATGAILAAAASSSLQFGYENDASTFALNGWQDDMRIYANRGLKPQEIMLLGSRRGIAYE